MKKREIKIREYCCLRTRIPTHGDVKHECGGNLITLPALEAGSPRLALPGSMISLQMRDSILTTQMTSGQLLNDSAAGNAIHHLQLTFISSPPYTAAQPVLFTVTAHSSPSPPPPFLSSACLILYIPLTPAKCTAVKTIISHLFPNSIGLKSSVRGLCLYLYIHTRGSEWAASLYVMGYWDWRPPDRLDKASLCRPKVGLYLSHRNRDGA